IPVGVINGRLSANSFKGYRRLRRFFRPVFASLDFAAVQDPAYAERFVAMGVPPGRCHITGSMKWDTARIEDDVPGSADLARFLLATSGELRKAYAPADVAVIGRTFGGPGGEGGSDPIEPIGLGKATVVGPAVANFASVVETFESAGALVRATPSTLEQV